MQILVTTLFLHIPTCILVLYGGLCILHVRMATGRLLGWGASMGIALVLFRSIPPLGIHVPLIILSYILLFRFLTRRSWAMCVLSTLLPNLLTVVGEGLLSVPIIYGMMRIPLASGLHNPWVTTAGGWISNLFLLGMCAWYFIQNHGGKRGNEIDAATGSTK